MEKENINQKSVDDNTTADEKKNDQPATTVHNPFEGGIKKMTQEELENLEQFKEAQTERD